MSTQYCNPAHGQRGNRPLAHIAARRLFALSVLGCVVLAGVVQAVQSSQPSTSSGAADSLTIRADWFDRGNVRAEPPGRGYADKYPCIWNAGELPNQAEYDIEFPVTAEYRFVALYTAMSSRPVDIYLDGKKMHRGFAGVTGSWQTSRANWEPQCTLHITEGRHTIKLLCPGPCMPHICAFRLESSAPFPPDWQLCRKIARHKVVHGDRDPEKTYVCDYPTEPPAVYDYHQPFEWVPPPTPRAHRILEYYLLGDDKYRVEVEIAPTDARAKAGAAENNELLLDQRGFLEADAEWAARLSVQVDDERIERDELNLSPARLRKMAAHALRLVDRFRAMDNVAAGYLQSERDEAEAIAQSLESILARPDDEAKWRAFYGLYVDTFRLKNRVALANPLIDFDKLLLAKRLTYPTSHIYTTYYDGSTRYKAGSGIVVLSPVRPDGQVTHLTGDLKPEAIYRDPDLSFDAQRVLFSYKPDRPTPCRIYEVGIDGRGLRQITESQYDDVDPCYLPSGKIIFVSTRCRRVTLCHNAYTVSVLHTMNADGSDIRCVSPNTVHDFKPSVMPNGQITFTRWEYVDKHLGNIQSLWTANPDGTRMTHVAGNHFGPLTYWEPFRIPGSRKFVCILGPHMPLACGPVGVVDPIHSSASPAIYENRTPELPPATHFSWLRKDVGYYNYAYPLSEDYFLVAYNYGPDDRDPTGYGIYLLDRWNNRDLVYRDPQLSAFEPLPVRPRKKPPVIQPRRDQRDPQPASPEDISPPKGTFYVADIYRGLPGIERGEVKYLRIVEEIPKPVSANCPGFAIQYPVMSNRGHLAVKRLWGTVPVEADGSAHFEAPADKALYFAALDENFMEIQRMRSFTSVAPGERFGCVGCHEPKHTAAVNATGLAMRREPSPITPPRHGGVHAPDFAYDVQPVIEKHCAKCHSGSRREGGVDLSGEYTNLFNVAYQTLTGGGYTKYVSAYTCDSIVTRPPKFYGSHASRVIETLLGMHREKGYVDMPPEDFRRLVTWIDCNCSYYGTYTFSRPHTVGGRELLVSQRQALADVFDRRCQECHPGEADQRVMRLRLPEVEQSRALLAPLSVQAGGQQTCGKPVFADCDDPDFQKLLEAYRTVREENRENPRADMLSERPPLTDPDCRYIFRP